MAVLSNVDLIQYIEEGKIKIDPFEKSLVQAATIDFRLGDNFKIPTEYGAKSNNGFTTIDEKTSYEEFNGKEIIIMPKHFILGTTLENLILPNNISGRVDGKSRIARKGLIVQGAGHVGPGFEGKIILELYNQRDIPIKLFYEQGICQLEFHELKTPSTKPYSGRYKGQNKATL